MAYFLLFPPTAKLYIICFDSNVKIPIYNDPLFCLYTLTNWRKYIYSEHYFIRSSSVVSQSIQFST